MVFIQTTFFHRNYQQKPIKYLQTYLPEWYFNYHNGYKNENIEEMQ